MTRYAERHQIALLMCAAVDERSDMMDERCKDISALLFAHLTERMPCQVAVTNPAPRAAIPLMLIVATGKMLVMTLHRFLVRLTVAAFSVCKIRTPHHAAGTFRFSRHYVSPSKSPRGELLLREG